MVGLSTNTDGMVSFGKGKEAKREREGGEQVGRTFGRDLVLLAVGTDLKERRRSSQRWRIHGHEV